MLLVCRFMHSPTSSNRELFDWPGKE